MGLISGMRAFVATVDAGNFTRAARDLGLSKAALSKQVAALEDHLGARLLHRTTRTLSLTHEGQVYVDRARQILHDLADAEEAVSPLAGEPRGKLRISAPHTFGDMHLTKLLSAFMMRYPDVYLDIEFSERIVNLVDEGFDLAVRISRLDDSTLIVRKITEVPMMLCATPAYWAAHGRPAHPRDLRPTAGRHKDAHRDAHRGIIYAYLPTPGEWRFREKGKPLAVKVAGALTTNNDVVIRAAALSGHGIFYGPDYIVRDDIRAGRLVPALEDYVDDRFSLYVTYPSRRNVSPKVRAFVDFLVDWFGAENAPLSAQSR